MSETKTATVSTNTTDIPAPPTIVVPNKGSKKTITYVWMPNANGDLIKADASVIKKSFAKLPADSQVALTEYLIGIANKQPTNSARQSLWNDIVDGAVAAFKQGQKQSPWDVLATLAKNSPTNTGQNVTYTNYDKLTADALLSKIAKSIGFDIALLSEADKVEYFDKLQIEAKNSGKSTTRKATEGGTETLITPATFDANTFTQSFLWAKVNFEDTTKIPSTAITQIAAIRNLLKLNGINYLSQKEINLLGVNLASGQTTIEALKSDLTQKAMKAYPQLAPRLQATPGLTVRDVAEPIINTVANVWEIDPSSIELDDPNIDKLIRPDGITGKMAPATISEAYNFAINHPNFDKTKKAKDMAFSGATAFLKAQGFGTGA